MNPIDNTTCNMMINSDFRCSESFLKCIVLLTFSLPSHFKTQLPK